jgi:hypothetical protein
MPTIFAMSVSIALVSTSSFARSTPSDSPRRTASTRCDGIERSGSSCEAYVSNFVVASACSFVFSTLRTPVPLIVSRTSLRTSAVSAMRSAQMSRAPASAAATSGTSFAGSTSPDASASGFAEPSCAHIASASGSRPRSFAMVALVRRFGLKGR